MLSGLYICLVHFSLRWPVFVMMSRINSGQPNVSQGFEMDVITGAVLGGVSVAGGEGRNCQCYCRCVYHGDLKQRHGAHEPV